MFTVYQKGHVLLIATGPKHGPNGKHWYVWCMWPLATCVSGHQRLVNIEVVSAPRFRLIYCLWYDLKCNNLIINILLSMLLGVCSLYFKLSIHNIVWHIFISIVTKPFLHLWIREVLTRYCNNYTLPDILLYVWNIKRILVELNFS